MLVATGQGPVNDYANETAQLWRGMGIPRQAIRCLPNARTTSEEIAVCRELVDKEGWHRVGLVTSAWHLPRALAHCRRQGLEVVPLAADWRGRMPGADGLWLIPQERGFAYVQLACWEYLALLLRR